MVDLRAERFDVQHRCAVEDVEIGHAQSRPGDAEQAHHGEPDRVGTTRRTGREQPPLLRAHVRNDRERIA
jgi:hypothetical protein